MNKMKQNSAITLIALVITIIVLLILAAVTLNIILGDNSIISKTQWSKFVTDFANIEEQINLYTIEKTLDEYSFITKQYASNEEVNFNVNEELKKGLFPVTTEKKDISNLPESLNNTIKELENIQEINNNSVILYVIDNEKINVISTEKYVINIVTGNIYKYDAIKYKGDLYHRPDTKIESNENSGSNVNIQEASITSDNPVITSYAFITQENCSVDFIINNINLTGNIQGEQVTVEMLTSEKGQIIDGEYDANNRKYTGKIRPNSVSSANGEYSFKIKAGDKEIIKSVEVAEFLNAPNVEIADLTDNGFKIKITDFPENTGIGFKYYVTDKTGNTIYASSDFENTTEKQITGLTGKTQYTIEIETSSGYTVNSSNSPQLANVQTPAPVNIYVSTTGSDSGDGSLNSPFQTVKKAIDSAKSGDVIFIKAGTYNLTTMLLTVGAQQGGVGVFDESKQLEIYGENEKTVLIFDGSSNTQKRDSHAITLNNENSIIRNLTFVYTPKSSGYDAVFGYSSYGTYSNLFIRVLGSTATMYEFWFYGKINNCTIFADAGSLTYGQRWCSGKYTKLATNSSTGPTNKTTASFGNSSTSLNDLILNSKNNQSFNSGQSGIYYGENAWR